MVITALVIVGYLSNQITYTKSVTRTKEFLSQTLENESPSRGKPIKWIDDREIKRLDDLGSGIKMFGFMPQPWFHPNKEYMPNSNTSYPWAFIKVRRWDLPFIVFDYYGWNAAPMWGRGGAKIYLCFFGLIIELNDYLIWIT